MQQALPKHDPNDMRVIDPLRRTFYSPQQTRLQGNEEAIFRANYQSLIGEWYRLRSE